MENFIVRKMEGTIHRLADSELIEMVKKKNICITINSLARGGAEKQSLLLAKALKPYHNTTVIIVNPFPKYEPHLAVISEEGLDHIFLTKNPIKKFSAFNDFLKKRKIDIIFSFLPTDTLWAAICGKIAKVPYIFGGIRNSHIPYIKFAALRFANNYLLNYTIANNHAAYDSAIEFGFKKKLMVVPNGIEIRPVRQIQNSNLKSITIISVGRLVKQKDYETALQALFELKTTLGTDYVLRYKIVGNGPEKANIEAIIGKYGLIEQVELILDPSNIYELLESADIYLCTSTFEGISNSIMEAMNCALPIIATDAGDNSRLVVNDENGFIASIGAYKAIAGHLGELINAPALRQLMGRESHIHLNENFGYHAFQKKYLNIIENIKTIRINDGEVRFE